MWINATSTHCADNRPITPGLARLGTISIACYRSICLARPRTFAHMSAALLAAVGCEAKLTEADWAGPGFACKTCASEDDRRKTSVRSDPTWSSSGCVKSSIASLFTMDATYACNPHTAKHSCKQNQCADGSRHEPRPFRSSAETRLSDSCYANLHEPLTHKRLRFRDIVLLAKLGKDLTATMDDGIGATTDAHILATVRPAAGLAYLKELLNHAQLRPDDPHLWVAEENAKAQHSAANKSKPHADERKAFACAVLKPRAGSIRAVIRRKSASNGRTVAKVPPACATTWGTLGVLVTRAANRAPELVCTAKSFQR